MNLRTFDWQKSQITTVVQLNLQKHKWKSEYNIQETSCFQISWTNFGTDSKWHTLRKREGTLNSFRSLTWLAGVDKEALGLGIELIALHSLRTHASAALFHFRKSTPAHFKTTEWAERGLYQYTSIGKTKLASD